MKAAIEKEVKGLMDAGTVKIIPREEIAPDANILPGRFVVSIKSTKDNEVNHKARFFIGGHRDKLKHMMVYNSISLQPSSIRHLLVLTVSYGFDI